MPKPAKAKSKPAVENKGKDPGKSEKPKRTLLWLSTQPDLCSHTLFCYTNENKTSIVCASCGSRRRLYRGQDGTVTSGTWTCKATE